MFNFLKSTLKKIYNQVTAKLDLLFAKKQLDEQTLQELELILIAADTGVQTTRIIIEKLKEKFSNGEIQEGLQLKQALQEQLLVILDKPMTAESNVYLLVGINGSGKTTFAGKLAHTEAKEGKKVLLVAADTFRAAASEQLTQWAKTVGADIFLGKQGQDPASVVFTGCEKFKQENYDVLIIDTAGRLQTKSNLMKELEKIKRVLNKNLPKTNINTLLTIDSMLGQNSLEQARLFNESTDVSSIVLTKMDGTGKGGIAFAIADALNIPIAYVSFGERPEQYKSFISEQYISQLLNNENNL